MEITSIFAPYLFSVKESDVDEFTLFMRNLHDVEWLTEFFQKNIKDLKNGLFYGPMTVKKAVQATLIEANELNALFSKMKRRTDNDFSPELDKFFKPLHNNELTLLDFQKTKAHGHRHKSWIRFYAIRVSEDTYIFTGGTIKLTDKMNHRQHTKEQLKRLESCLESLKQEEIIDSNSFFEFLIQ